MGLLDPQALEYFGLLGQSMLAGQSPNAGVNIGNAMMYADTEMRRKAAERARLEEERQQAKMRDMAMQKALREQEAQDYMGRGIQQFMRPPQAATQQFGPGDMETPSQLTPASPGGFDQAGFAKYLAQNPATAQQALQFAQKSQPQFKEVGGRLVAIGNDNSVKEVYAPPEKPKFQEGDTRVIESGRVKHTYEFRKGQWVPIAKSAIDKPDGEAGPGGQSKPPQGYRWKQDGSGLEPIPGGPADAKVGKEAEALKKRESGALARADFVLGKVKEAINQTDKLSAGTLGGLTKNIPNTPAYNLNRVIDPIKANIGFAELQAMREASPTGGALGQVAVQELNMLQSVLGSLDTAQSPDQLLNSLYSIEKHFNNWKRAVKQAETQPSQQQGQPQDDPLGLRK